MLIQAEKGNELAAFDVPDNAFIKELTFAGGDTIISIAVADSGIRLLQFNFRNGIWKELLKTTSANITSPVWKDGKIFFESGANGTNNIYSLNPADGQVHRMTAARFGAFDPSFGSSDGRLFFSDYQADGYALPHSRLTVCSLKRQISTGRLPCHLLKHLRLKSNSTWTRHV